MRRRNHIPVCCAGSLNLELLGSGFDPILHQFEMPGKAMLHNRAPGNQP